LVAPEPDGPVTTLERGDLRIELESSVVRLSGALDMEGAPLLEDKLMSLISGSADTVIVDLTELEFVDSTGLQALMRATNHAREHGDNLRFRRGSGQVEGVMRLTKVADELPFVD
jgi:anti-sigma B factor antagonist